jgi:hypothetical protein
MVDGNGREFNSLQDISPQRHRDTERTFKNGLVWQERVLRNPGNFEITEVGRAQRKAGLGWTLISPHADFE